MFDIGFWEICLIAVVALLVFGPEKLPGAARTAGLWVGRARRFIGTVKQDIDKELRLQEMQEAIKQSDNTGLHELIEETKTGLSKLNQPINQDSLSSTENKSPSTETRS
jgi:sec-independent protein translocase protein TatB